MLTADAPSAANATRLSVVQPAGQLADDQQIGPAQDVSFQRACGLQSRPCAGGPEVRVHAQLATQRQQRRLRALGGRPVVKARVADCAQEHGIRGLRGCQRGIGQRAVSPPAGRRRRSDVFGEFPGMAEGLADSAEHLRRSRCDFRADAVTRHQDDMCVHTPNPYPASCPASRVVGRAARPATSIVICRRSSSDTCFFASASVTMRR